MKIDFQRIRNAKIVHLVFHNPYDPTTFDYIFATKHIVATVIAHTV